MEVRVPFSSVAAEVAGDGPIYQYTITQGATSDAGTLAPPATIAASGTFTSSVLPLAGMPHIAASAKLSTTGTISLQRYLDNLGSVVTGSAVTLALAAGTTGVIDSVSTLVVGSFTMSIINTGTVTGTLTVVNAILQAR